MKNLSCISSIFLLVFFLASCGNDGIDPTPATATFRVEFSQTGDYEKFIRIVSISGGDFKYTGTNDVMPGVILGENLNVASFSAEATDVRELTISTIAGFSPVEDGLATMGMKFTIFKNGVKLDEKIFTYTETTQDRTEDLSYKAN